MTLGSNRLAKTTPNTATGMTSQTRLQAITISPADTDQFWEEHDLVQRYKKVFQRYKRKLRPIVANSKDFALFMEMSKYGRIHFHGYYEPVDKLAIAHSSYKLRQHANVDIDECNDEKLWKNYCKKDISITPICMPITVHHFFKTNKEGQIIKYLIDEVD